MFAVRSSQFAVRHFCLVLTVISLAALCFLYHYAGIDSYWVDELYTVSAIRSSFSFSDTVKIYSSVDVNAPLYHFIAYFWYRLVPHTEQALKTLSIILSLLACIVTGMTGKKMHSAKTGLLAFLFILASRIMLINSAFQFRPYSMLLLAAALTLYFYLARLKHETWTNIVLYGVTMCLLPYSHYVAVFICFGLFIADCVLILRKRSRPRIIVSYFLGALLFLPWLYLMLASRSITNDFGFFHPKVPAFKDIVSVCKWLVGAHSVMDIPFWLTLCGMFFVLREAYKLLAAHEKFSDEIIFLCACIFSSAFMILSVFIKIYARIPLALAIGRKRAYSFLFCYNSCHPFNELRFAGWPDKNVLSVKS